MNLLEKKNYDLPDDDFEQHDQLLIFLNFPRSSSTPTPRSEIDFYAFFMNVFGIADLKT